MNGGLRSKRRRIFASSGEIDPMEGITNIMDVMLVLASGLMLALSVYWNIDLGPVGERVDLQQGREVTESLDLRDDLIETRGEGELYEKMGTVYKDPRTGKLFMLTDR
ncbi:MAG: DUF2149 domain-containing protein [Natronincolaceae bacterium]|nr:hypothetical protein [Bacillota bacterium]NLK91216.1 DUF2149 domain-containing protein [Clostridiales bacterium]